MLKYGKRNANQEESFDRRYFIATTNYHEKFDYAVARRFEFEIKLDYLLPKQALNLHEQLVIKVSQLAKDKLLRLTCLTLGDFNIVARNVRYWVNLTNQLYRSC